MEMAAVLDILSSRFNIFDYFLLLPRLPTLYVLHSWKYLVYENNKNNNKNKDS